ncbi:MAG: hypothetical protein AAGL49_10985, partial [Pseudomonadota bacterium]
MIGGTFAEIHGGNFSSGFLAAGFSSALGRRFDELWQGAAYHAVIGGVGSVLGGGKFAAGAVTGAGVYVHNHFAHQEYQQQYREALDKLKGFIGVDFETLSDETRHWIKDQITPYMRTLFTGGTATLAGG